MSSTNNSYPSWPPQALNCEFNQAPSIAMAICDLVYWDNVSKTIKPASQLPDLGTALLTQCSFANVFAGVSNSVQLATDSTSRPARFWIDYIFEFPCASNTFEVGDLVGINYTATGLGIAGCLSDQVLTKVTNIQAAIGRVCRRYPTATTVVKCWINSRLFSDVCNTGVIPLLNGFNQLGAYATPPAPVSVPVTGGTITPPISNGTMLVNPAGNITGVILAPGTTDGQQLMILNQANATITFAASGSNVAAGSSAQVPALRSSQFVWSATNNLWISD